MRVVAGLFAFLFAAGLSAVALAQSAEPAPAPPAQVQELLKLLAEPGVRTWLDDQLKAAASAKPQGAARELSSSRLFAERLALVRARLDRLGAAVPHLPEEFRNAADTLAKKLQSRSLFDVVLLILGFAALGWGAQWAFWRATARPSTPKPSTPMQNDGLSSLSRLTHRRSRCDCA